jgi:hypothetical protein
LSTGIEVCTRIDLLEMTYQKGFDKISGIVGMSTGLYKNSAPLLVKELYEEGAISEPIFGFYLGGTD